jgi:hypothetical protein
VENSHVTIIVTGNGPGGMIQIGVYNGHQQTDLLYDVEVHNDTRGPRFSGVYTNPADLAAASSSFSSNS